MSQTPEQIAATIAALEAQRALLGDAVVDSALEPLRRELAALRSPEPAPQQQLKQVSVLFVDVVGSTAMGQELEPEDIHALMDGALERFTAIVRSHHGRVMQYTGDGMLAAFGADGVQEDDVEAAIRAGLAVVEDAQCQAPLLLERHGVPDFNVRAGVHTGTVLLGGGVDAEGSIRGATVNVAARMEQSAPPGRLRISHDSYRHVRGLFEVEEQVPISVKGVAQPLRSYLVDRAMPTAFRVATRGIEGVDSRMVGRDAELGVLRRAFDAVVAERSARAVTVVGDAGLGKSRLLAEFLQTVDLQTCWLLLGRAHPRSTLQPYGLLRDMLARQLQIGESEPAELARQKLIDLLAPLFEAEANDDHEAEAAIHLLGQLIGFDFSASPHVRDLLADEQDFTQRAFEAVALCLRRLGERRAVVLVMDDLHWADAGSLAFMRHVLRSNHDTPLLGLTLTRQSFFEQQPDWITESDPWQTRLDLKPLGKADSQVLAEVLLQRLDEVPAALRALVTGGAEGNPFYMEELVKMLIDDGVIVADAEAWRVLPDKLLAARVPSTLNGVLQARLDALSAGERLALQQAAVVGHVFWDQALAAIDPAATGALPALLNKRLIVRRDDSPALATDGDDTREYAFQHHLLHQVTYDSVLKAPKRTGHARVGDFWSARAEVAGPQDVNPAACRALAEAQHHRCQADAQACIAWFEGQFSHYLNAYAAQTLRPLAEQLIAVCEREFGPEHAQTAKALTNLARVHLLQGGAEQAEPLLRRALAAQEAALGGEHQDTARTLAVLGGCFMGRGDHAAAEPLIRRALAIRERVLGAEDPLTVSTLDQLASSLSELGRHDEAEPLSRRVLEIRERLLGPDDPETAVALTTLADLMLKRRDFAAAEPLARRALAAQQRTLPANHPDIGLSMWNLAEALRELGRLDEAEPLAEQTLAMWEQALGAEHPWTAWGLSSLAELRLAQQRAAEALPLAERSLRIHESTVGAEHPTVAAGQQLLARALSAQANAAGE
jgi:class 3 adenylate cyclase/tetratricopeptide (TPR) repeat protein